MPNRTEKEEIEGYTARHYIDARSGRGTGLGILEALITDGKFGPYHVLVVAAVNRTAPGVWLMCRHLHTNFLN